MSILSEPHFHCEAAAVERLEAIVWPSGPVCPKCGGLRNTQIKGKTARPGLRSCTECRQQFRVTVGTIFERSHVPLHKWFQAAHLLASSKKGISAHQLHRTLKVTYKTAWFMEHRLREAMAEGRPPLLGGKGKPIAKGDDKKQSRLFIDKAREIEADEKSSASDLLLGRLAKMAPAPRAKKKKSSISS